MTTHLIFVRHGELGGENSSVLHHADDPVSLSEQGRETIKGLVSSLRNAGVQAIVSSPEIRTQESAQILSQELSIPVELVDALQGRKWGDFAGKSWKEVGEVLGALSLEERYEFVPPNGESWKAFEARILAALSEIANKFVDQKVCIVSHGSSVRVLLPKVFGVSVEESLKLYPDYGSISIVDYVDGKFANPQFNLRSM